MRCLVTGATGYVGINLCRSLLAAGCEVDCLLRPTSDTSKLKSLSSNINIWKPLTQTETVKMLEVAKPDVVFHLASLFIARHKNKDITPLIESNITFPTQLLDAMVATGTNKIVNIGSIWQNYDGNEYNPSCLYAATKQAFQDILKYYVEANGIRSITLKLSDTYGPDDPRPKIMNLLQKIVKTGETLAMSPGEQLIDLVYIDDVIRAIIMSGEILISSKNKICPNEFIISSKKPVRLRTLVGLIEKYLKTTLNINWGTQAYRDREIMVPWDGGEWLPGWKPRIDIVSGINSLEW